VVASSEAYARTIEGTDRNSKTAIQYKTRSIEFLHSQFKIRLALEAAAR
jgi:hypothetical protein